MAKSKRKQVTRRGGVGIYSNPNYLEAPPGALAMANNAFVYRPGVVSKRRGFNRHGQQLDWGAKALSEYQKRMILLDGTTLKYDSDGEASSWSSWSGSYVPPASHRMEFLESNQNLYFTEDQGVQKTDALGGSIGRAGTPQALDLRVSSLATGLGLIDPWWLPDTQLSYRIVWKKKDANLNEILGSPSFREKVANPKESVTLAYSGGTVTVTHTAHDLAFSGSIVYLSDLSDAGFGEGRHTVTVVDVDTYTYTDGIGSPPGSGTGKSGPVQWNRIQFPVPNGIASGDYYQIYRTLTSASGSTDPGDRHYLVEEQTYDGSGGLVTYDDTMEEGLLRKKLPLYTNDSEEGLAQAADRPPWCKTMAGHKGHSFYGNYRLEEYIEIQLLSSMNAVVGDSVTITVDGVQLVYKFALAENSDDRKFRLYTTADSETPTETQVIEYTTKSLCRVINLDSSSKIHAYYISGIDDASGRVLLKRYEVNTTDFTVRSTIGADFSPDLSTALGSQAKVRLNGILRSKYKEPEAVPELNEHFVGREDREIIALVVASETLFVVKEDGLFKIIGESDKGAGLDFSVEEVDLSVKPIANHSFVGLDNAVFGYTTYGITRIVETGASIVSDPIANLLDRASVSSSFNDLSHGIAYEKAHFYIFFIPEENASEAGVGWVYNHLRKAWGRMTKPVNCGHVFSQDDKLYLSNSRDKYILKERKNFNSDDYLDEGIDATVSSDSTTTNEWNQTVSTVTLSYSYWRQIERGWFFDQGVNKKALVDSVTDHEDGTYTLTLDRQITISAGAATLSMAIDMEIEWLPEAADAPGISKQFPNCQLTMEGNGTLHHLLGFQANHQNKREYVEEIYYSDEDGWQQFPWAQEPWGQPDLAKIAINPRTSVPLDHQRCESLRVYYRNKTARESVDILQMALDTRLYGSRTQIETEPI